MDPAIDAFRYERKFVVPREAWSRVESAIRFNPAIFSKAFEPRTVNNLYLDSPALRHYFLNLAGAAERTKVRIRWYGSLFGHVPRPVLEFKCKRGLLGA